MARQPRLYLTGCSHHVIQRGNSRQACFLDEADSGVYLGRLRESSQKYGVAVPGGWFGLEKVGWCTCAECRRKKLPLKMPLFILYGER